jgi:hypothetical protein
MYSVASLLAEEFALAVACALSACGALAEGELDDPGGGSLRATLAQNAHTLMHATVKNRRERRKSVMAAILLPALQLDC